MNYKAWLLSFAFAAITGLAGDQTLRTMGVVVEGDGKIQVGPKLGLSVIIR